MKLLKHLKLKGKKKVTLGGVGQLCEVNMSDALR